MATERIERLKREMLDFRRELSLERAYLYTKSYQATEGEPVITRRAKATAAVMDGVSITIRPGELLGGNRTIKPRSGIASPEMDPYWIYDELDTLASRPQDPFWVSEQDKRLYREEIYPYWLGRSLKDLVKSRLHPEIQVGEKLKIFKLNQTDKGQGHIIMDFPELLSCGLGQITERVAERSRLHPDSDFYAAALIVLQATSRHILRYAHLAEDMALREPSLARRGELTRMAAIAHRVAFLPPEDFDEACQLFWFVNLAAQYESNASSISSGRFDQYMLPFYRRSLTKGVSESYLRELLCDLWLKMNDVVLLRSRDSARYFAGFPTGYTIVLGGLDRQGRCAVNELSRLILETYQEICLPQPNLGVRVNELTPDAFLRCAAETVRLGTGIPQFFNDEVIVPGFLNRGVELEHARDYAVVGCVELSIPGKTYGLHDIALFNLVRVMELTLVHSPGEFSSFEQLLEAIKGSIDEYVAVMVQGCDAVDACHADLAPTPLLSCLVDGCIERGKDVSAGGAKYNFSGVQGVGTANLSDSLYAIKQLVFTTGQLRLEDLVSALTEDFPGSQGEVLRHRMVNKYAKFGNDVDAVDDIGADLLRHYCRTVANRGNVRGGRFLPGAYTVSAHVPLGAGVGATADGRHRGDQLADGGLSPMPGRDKNGPTAVLKSVSKLDNYLTSNGSLLNLKFHPSALARDTGLEKMVGFIRAFMRLKLQHVQFNVVSAQTLRDAQAHPEQYKSLVVRVAGYSALFGDLDKSIQDDIIARTEHSW